MSVALDNKIIPADVAALFAAANSKPRLLRGQPYKLFTNDPLTPITNRGAWSSSATYNYGDLVSYSGWQFIATATTTNDPPLYTAADGLISASTNWGQNWLNCYNRLRAAIQQAVGHGLVSTTGRGLIYPWQMSVSGGTTDDGYVGWPCQSPDALYNDQWFYFADTGGTVTVTVSASIPNSNYTTFNTTTVKAYNSVYYNGGQPPDSSVPALTGITPTAFPTSLLSELFIGGNQPVAVSCTFTIAAQLFQGGIYHSSGVLVTSDGTDPAALASVDASAFLPGATFTKATVGNSVVFTCVYSGTVSPGRYGVTITGSAGGDDNYYGYAGDLTMPSRALLLQGSYYSGLRCSGSISLTNSTAVATNGIHGTKTVKKIAVPAFNSTTGLPFGVFWVSGTSTETDNLYADSSGYGYPGPYRVWNWQLDPFPQPTFDGIVIFGPSAVSITASTSGFWFGQTPPIQSGGMDGLDQYQQWNNFHVNSAGEVDSTTPIPYTGSVYYTGVTPQPAYSLADSSWERQLMPCAWVAHAYYPLGFQIQDSNGNLQTVVVAGRSGGTAPAWSTNPAANTVEPNYSGVHTQAGVQWQVSLVTNPPAPATAKRFSLATYPVAWQTDLSLSPGALKSRLVPGMTQVGYSTGSHLADKSVVGWWIYRVYLNRVNSGGAIAVTLGCMRNGSFVAFGTFNTGSVVNAMWPVFTSDALIYQASERVDVQAIILTCGLGYATWGTAGYPIMLAYWQDVANILNLINNTGGFNSSFGFNTSDGF